MQPLLELNNVTKTIYNQNEDINILNGVSLKIYPEDFIVILGTNGAGKSTLFDSITGALNISSGKILLNNLDITSKNLNTRSKYISRVYQDPKFGTSPKMTVAENLLLAKRRGLKRRLIFRNLKKHLPEFEERLSEFKTLDNRLNTFTNKLSGGQRQTLSFLMSIIQKPDLLMLDEHTAALDPQTSHELMEKTDEVIKKEKLTCMMVTHNLEDAMKYGNRLIILQHGQIISDFNSEEKAQLKEKDLLKYF
ncbi:ABC transporter ATP-binding protein [Lactobacillus terrae]|uniref:ABC transporter ATP-binding protein n=1 Tax=Lactobacillus terrae TaxID=2269374 RepID=UPI000C1B7000|nr:ATP-binding cassette domain-containing protein [Lactobacillus terrae]